MWGKQEKRDKAKDGDIVQFFPSNFRKYHSVMLTCQISFKMVRIFVLEIGKMSWKRKIIQRLAQPHEKTN